MKACHTIAIFNHKGGVGKTTTAVNLAASLAHAHKKRVLVVDMDPQANATRALLGRELREDERSIRHLLAANSSTGVGLTDIFLATGMPDVILAPSDIALSEVEARLVSRPHREYLLRNSLRSIASSFDFLIVDCPPSIGLLSLNALTAADTVICPVETQFLALRGLHYVLDVVQLVKERLNPQLGTLKVLATKFHPLSSANREVLQYLAASQSTLSFFQTVIYRDVRAEEAPNHGLPLILYAPESRAAQQYLRLADEVMQICRA